MEGHYKAAKHRVTSHTWHSEEYLGQCKTWILSNPHIHVDASILFDLQSQ